MTNEEMAWVRLETERLGRVMLVFTREAFEQVVVDEPTATIVTAGELRELIRLRDIAGPLDAALRAKRCFGPGTTVREPEPGLCAGHGGIGEEH